MGWIKILIPLNDTEYLESTPGMKEKIIEGLQTPVEECTDEPGWEPDDLD